LLQACDNLLSFGIDEVEALGTLMWFVALVAACEAFLRAEGRYGSAQKARPSYRIELETMLREVVVKLR